MKLIPDQREILRYLGHHGQEIDPQTAALLTHCVAEMQGAIKPRYTYGVFTIQRENDHVSLLECGLSLPGKDIDRHLAGCKRAILLAVTLGIEADNLIRIAQAESMSRAVVFDACATELVEKLCDKAETELAGIAAKENLTLTGRFSPGYGDLPITIQNRIGEILDTSRKIGLTMTENALMLPRKSVTAILGFTDQIIEKKRSCNTCSMKGCCNFQKEGSSCES